MITEAQGNLLTAPVEALVNTVNTMGVMGKGIALQFKKAFPEMFKAYAAAARRGEVKLGRMHVWPTQTLDGPQYIINFPTKGHWRAKSRVADIDSGLADLVKVVQERGITSIAVPPLGCGNGGLDWAEVEPRIRAAFDQLPGVDVRVYPPTGAPKADNMPVNTTKPKMTPGRAALVGMIARYTQQAFDAPSLIEAQKLMYFLQVAGEPLRLDFKPNRYGPYADNLRHVLAEIEGHYLFGYGDGTATVPDAAPLEPARGALPAAEHELDTHPETRTRMEQVLDLAEGFETAYGMELLATVHWVAMHGAAGQSDATVAAKIAEWSPRKARMFTPEHVDTALTTLREHGLVDAA
ncbi:Appr-1-p processing protein [Pseudactinotalea sp. HY160]|uniref:type II toxin-antitoxin system antitoxin DNA ADP-ribosyl glycohydrolase DarG n=1 Tax=Pseudactinotalea sp. HY160 TaxID=2654490 RepID=UPI00128DACF9|nr:macro domain-containing protein [Pseudactinotalea sp. HY160]MPV50870.1 Appr-1-p processing protein [Pseudactinotalea sp. HY160]